MKQHHPFKIFYFPSSFRSLFTNGNPNEIWLYGHMKLVNKYNYSVRKNNEISRYLYNGGKVFLNTIIENLCENFQTIFYGNRNCVNAIPKYSNWIKVNLNFVLYKTRTLIKFNIMWGIILLTNMINSTFL